MEVIDFIVTDEQNRRLDDWANPLVALPSVFGTKR